MTPSAIRRAGAGDLEQLCRLYIAFHEFHVRGVPDRLLTLGAPEHVDCTETIATLQRLLEQPDAALFVAVDDTTVVGLAEVTVRQDESTGPRVAYRYGHLQSLMVQEGCRRRHVGKRLVDAAEQWAVQQGATEMRLDIWEFPAGPLPFYERLGYRTLRRTLTRRLPGTASTG